MTDTKRDIAELLKTQRENLGLSIDEIFERTRIAPGFLQAFEDGNFDVLPRAYARLFLKTYARELDLDVQDILTRFEKIIVTQSAPPPVQAPTKHRLNFRLSSLLLIACVLIMAAIIILNIRQKAELAAPLDPTPSQPPVAQPPAEIQPTLQDSAHQTDDPTSARSDTLQIMLPKSENDAGASQSENQEMPMSESENDAGVSQSENQETPTPESENTAAAPLENQETPTPESENDAGAAPLENQEAPSPAQSDTGQPTPESENTAAAPSENQETPTPESENDAGAAPTENQEMPSPAQSDTGQPTPESEADTATAPSENQEMPSSESENDAGVSQLEDQEMPSSGREPGVSGPPAPDVLTTYNLPLPVVIADGDRMILSCVATENTSLFITADGRALFQGVLPAGSTYLWRASDHFQIYVQRAGAISLSLQDAPIESASPPDRSLRLNISRTLIRVEEVEER